MAKDGRIWLSVDVNYYDDDKVVELDGPASPRELDFAAMLTAKRLQTDTLSRRQLEAIATRIGASFGAIDDIVRVGLWHEFGGSYTRNAWDEWNESADDIAAMVKGGKKGNHLRWHVRRNVVDPDCSFCLSLPESGAIETESPPESGPESLDKRREDLDKSKSSASPAARDEVFEFLCEIDHIDWKKATPKELGRVRSARKGLSKVEATPDQIKSVKAAMESAGWKPQMITSTSIESNFSKFLDTAETQPSAIKACWKCYALTSRECSIYADCPNKPGATQITACSLCGDEFSNQPCYIKDECPRRATNG